MELPSDVEEVGVPEQINFEEDILVGEVAEIKGQDGDCFAHISDRDRWTE